MSSRSIMSVRDASNEVSTVSVEAATVNAGNFAAQAALQNALTTAIQDIIVGHLFEEKLIATIASIAGAVSSPFAQRELKWLVSMRETANLDAHTLEVPTPDLAKLVTGSDLANMADADIIAFVTAIEAYYRFNGLGAATVETIRMVGRNL